MSVTPCLERPLAIDGDENRHFRTDQLTEDSGGRSTRGGAVTLVSQVVKFLSSLVATVILARLLTSGFRSDWYGRDYREFRFHVSVHGTIQRNNQMG